jgi:hypothetical protein
MSPAIVTVVTSRAQVEGGLTLFLPLHTCARGNNGNNRALLHEAQHRPGPQSRAALWLPREGEGHPPTGAHRCTKGGRRTFGAPSAHLAHLGGKARRDPSANLGETCEAWRGGALPATGSGYLPGACLWPADPRSIRTRCGPCDPSRPRPSGPRACRRPRRSRADPGKMT